MFGAGADTVRLNNTECFFYIESIVGAQTAAAISSVVLAAAVYPEAQAKVQEELDLVIGSDKGDIRLFLFKMT